jgi:hypothetical protein
VAIVENYRNKRFVDATAIWSGHKEVASYIAFCKKRVPGLNESTVMNDSFRQDPMGILVLNRGAGARVRRGAGAETGDSWPTLPRLAPAPAWPARR